MVYFPSIVYNPRTSVLQLSGKSGNFNWSGYPLASNTKLGTTVYHILL